MTIPSTIPHHPPQASYRVTLVRSTLGLSRHWLVLLSLLLFVWVGLPWLAPVFMHLGWTAAGRAIYLLYAFQCHQLPERSFFLFGRQAMYSLAQIQAAGADVTNPFLLRQFIGNPDMGWKVAWSDRMVSMYTSWLLFGLLYGLVRKWLRPLPLWGFALLLLPMAVDGTAHFVSDLAGVGQGFRDTNAWLAVLTHNALPSAFYAGDALGSFNSWARLLTGLLFGLAVVWLAWPHLQAYFGENAGVYEDKLQKAGTGQE